MTGPITVTLSSQGNTTSVSVDYIGGKPVSAVTYATSNSTASWRVQFTMQDIQSTATIVWSNAVAPTYTMTSTMTGTIFTGSANGLLGTLGVPIFLQFMSPIAGLRIASTEAGLTASNTATLSILQGRGA